VVQLLLAAGLGIGTVVVADASKLLPLPGMRGPRAG
jgi:hypothetical protein